MSRSRQPALTIHGIDIAPGTRTTIDLPIAGLYTHTPMTMPVHVVAGRRAGPRLFVSAAIHGDEINGVEIIRRLLRRRILERLRGVLVAVPIVNVHGFIYRTRYLPDRRDLNRSFPGSEHGSLTARLAHRFITEIVQGCTHGIDLHTGAAHRSNWPQIRARLDDPETARLANAFGVSVVMHSDYRDGSLRQVASELGLPVLLYEAGEALRFDDDAIHVGVRGIVNVMTELGMLPRRPRRPVPEPLVATASTWVRAPVSGILRITAPLGASVHEGERLGIIADPFGEGEARVAAPVDGMVVGRINLPLVNEGEALFHIARTEPVPEGT